MKPRLYIETTIVSYLTARPTRDLTVTSRQQSTLAWWERRRGDFLCFASDTELDEAKAGDPQAAERRLEALTTIPVLEPREEATVLARKLTAAKAIPRAAASDALHIATAAVHGMHFLLTWNFRHIANAEMMDSIRAVCTQAGYICPVICTPDELMRGET